MSSCAVEKQNSNHLYFISLKVYDNLPQYRA